MPTTALLTALVLVGLPASEAFDIDARLALGPGLRLDDGGQTELAFEGGILLRIRLDGRQTGMAPTLLPELSYLSLLDEGTRDDLGVFGFGYGWTSKPLVLGIVPGLVVGQLRNDDGTRGTGVGLRVIAIAELTHIIGVQAGYVGVYNGDAFRNELYATVSLNFLGLALLYIYGSRG